MTQKEMADNNIISEEMRIVAEQEGVTTEYIIEGIKKGEIVIPKNVKHKIKKVCGIGKGLSVKVNANIGASPLEMDINKELEKLKVAEKYGADTVMDLSICPVIKDLRKEILKNSSIPVGTVPIYETAYKLSHNHREIWEMGIDDILETIKIQAEEGVDFMTVHCGVTLFTLERMKNEKRILDIVSRGGSILVKWMERNRKENPMYEYFDEILKIAKEYDVTLSLGDGFRPGSVIDASDRAQFQELIIIGELAQRAQSEGVQVMIEGPGHIPLNEIEMNIKLEKALCHNAPFYVLGPLVTDIAPGYDHITSAIGGALAAYFGADFLCYVTPAEHLRLPTVEDVKEGVIASKIAAHSADLAKGKKKAIQRDWEISKARKELDWETQFKLSIDPEKSRKYREESKIDDKVCTMCGDFCAIKQIKEAL